MRLNFDAKSLFGKIAHNPEPEIRKTLVRGRGLYRNENSKFDSGP